MRQPRRSAKRDHWVSKGPVSVNLNAGPSRETKRELFQPKFMAGAQIASRMKGIENMSGLRANRPLGLSLKSSELEKIGQQPGQSMSVTKSNQQASVKGKKAIAHSRATINDVSNIVGTSNP